MFETLLIANRGEIACRVIRTARRLGLRTLAVYSEADASAPHVRAADAALPIGPPPARESYLCVDRILEAARRGGAQAIHPGYGFLSENAEFAEACAAEGLVFVGPPPAAIRSMGRKDEAKRRMQAAAVPVVPGYHGEQQDAATLAREAARIGFPVLVKAVAGGGGRGMRRVASADELEAALDAARREAAAAFGDASLLLEKWIEKARHVEVQIFADAHGHAIHLFERDCSLQRRHQKVLEEAPAPGLSARLREDMGEAAVRAARSIDYRGAGTVEFLLDAQAAGDAPPFYFMEMNTRLQVEHPITEEICGVDLVEWQLRVAAGEPLPLEQAAIQISGHAIEARVYAEDASRGYLPQTGRLWHFVPPQQSEHVRVDSGVAEGDEIGPHYDPLIAKLVVRGENRAGAVRQLRRALEGFELAGVTTNLPLLAAVAAHAAFETGEIDTGFLARHEDDLQAAFGASSRELLALACAGLLEARAQRAWPEAGEDPWSPWACRDGFRLNTDGFELLTLAIGRREVTVRVGYESNGWSLCWEDSRVTLSAVALHEGRIRALVEDERRDAAFVERGDTIYVAQGPHSLRLRMLPDTDGIDEEATGGGAVLAPLPGRVLAVMVREGERVAKGQALVRIEAMKMEHTLRATAAGVVKGLAIEEGEQLEEGAVLLEVETAPT